MNLQKIFQNENAELKDVKKMSTAELIAEAMDCLERLKLIAEETAEILREVRVLVNEAKKQEKKEQRTWLKKRKKTAS